MNGYLVLVANRASCGCWRVFKLDVCYALGTEIEELGEASCQAG
jgi:hypothetical protein